MIKVKLPLYSWKQLKELIGWALLQGPSLEDDG